MWRKSIHEELDCLSVKYYTEIYNSNTKRRKLIYIFVSLDLLVHEYCRIHLLSSSHLPLFSAYEIHEKVLQAFW